MIWEKKGFVCGKRDDVEWLKTGMSSSAVEVLDEDEGIIRIYVGGRNIDNKTFLGCIYFDVFNHKVLKIDKDPILMQDILEVFESDPKLAEINSNVRHDEGYKKSLKKDQEFIKRGKTSDEK